MKSLTRTRLALYGAAAVCLALSAFFKFCMVGYLMSALVFLGIAACLILYGALAGRKTPAAKRLRIAMTVLLIIGLILFLIAEVPILRHARSDGDVSAPYLLVCGAGLVGRAPSRSLADRLTQALAWLDANPDGAAILSGSQGPTEEISEARAMFDWLAERGVDPARLILEEQADNSFENIQNALSLIAARGGDPSGRLAILSSEYHLYRLGCMAERLGCQPALVAARTSKASLFVNYAIREAFAMWKLWIFGP